MQSRRYCWCREAPTNRVPSLTPTPARNKSAHGDMRVHADDTGLRRGLREQTRPIDECEELRLAVLRVLHRSARALRPGVFSLLTFEKYRRVRIDLAFRLLGRVVVERNRLARTVRRTHQR